MENSDGTLLEWARARLTVQTLIIFQDRARLEISENGRRVQWVDLDGKGSSQGAGGKLQESRRGHWDHADLVTTSDLDGGGTLTETFRLASDGSKLEVAARIRPGSNGPLIVMNRVYKRYAGA
jgi:hypothetical protein